MYFSDANRQQGSAICGVTLGNSRDLIFRKNGYVKYTMPTNKGGLYAYWKGNLNYTHEITKTDVPGVRISFTFRSLIP